MQTHSLLSSCCASSARFGISLRRTLGYATVAASLGLVSDAHAQPPSEYKLVWEEHFRDKALYESRWAFRAPGWRDEGNRYLNTPEMVSIDHSAGQLVISTAFGAPSKAGMVGTQGRKFLHGYFEVKMTLPTKVGHHVAFWIKSDEYDRVGPPATHGAEVDVIEYLARYPTTAHFNIHTYGYAAEHQTIGAKAEGAVCRGCTHVFGLLWTANAYTFFVDGKPHWTTDKSVSGVPQYLILSSHASKWGGAPAKIPGRDAVVFHHVRVYQPQ